MTTAISSDKIKNLPLPPATKGYPLIGSFPNILNDMVGYLLECHKTFGDIFSLDLGLTKAIMVCHPDYVQYVLRDNFRNFDKSGSFWKASRVITGEGLITIDGDNWLKRRRLMQPHFHRKRLESLTNLMVEAVDEGMVEWEEYERKGEVLDMPSAFYNITMRVIGKTMFGTALNADEIEEVAEDMGYILDYMILGLVTFALPNWMPLPGMRRYLQAKQKVDDALQKVIERCRYKPLEERDDLISMLIEMLDSNEDGESLTLEEFEDETRTLFLAGYETTSVALIWAIHHIVQQPKVYRKLQNEIDLVLGDEVVEMKHLRQLKYTRMVCMETLRHTPPGWWVPRTVVEDDEIGGYQIPAGSTLICLNLASHRHPDFWEEPHKFDPERFEPERYAKQHRFAWTPFGAGQRQCIGKEMALMEMTIVLAMMMQRYDFTAKPGHVVEQRITTTLKPSNSVLMQLEKRSARQPVPV